MGEALRYAGIRHPVLTAAEERAACEALVAARAAGDGPEVERLRGHLLTHNLRLIARHAQRFAGRGLPVEDLIGEGSAGFLRALDDFDPSRGWRLSTYASWWVRHAIHRAIDDKSRAVRVPVHMLDAHHRIRRATEAARTRAGREPTAEELSNATGLSQDKLTKATAAGIAAGPTFSLDRTIDGDGATFLDCIRDPGPPADEIIETDRREALARQLMAGLPERLRTVIRQRFNEGRTLEEVGAALGGYSRERVRQLQVEALAAMAAEARRRGFAI